LSFLHIGRRIGREDVHIESLTLEMASFTREGLRGPRFKTVQTSLLFALTRAFFAGIVAGNLQLKQKSLLENRRKRFLQKRFFNTRGRI
jgi:hypothetical protein